MSFDDPGRQFEETEKLPYEYQQHGPQSPITDAGHLSDPTDKLHSLHRGLAARQVSMIAIGGAIGSKPLSVTP